MSINPVREKKGGKNCRNFTSFIVWLKIEGKVENVDF